MDFGAVTKQITNSLAASKRYKGSFQVSELSNYLTNKDYQTLFKLGFSDRFASTDEMKTTLLSTYAQLGVVNNETMSFLIVPDIYRLYVGFSEALSADQLKIITDNLKCTLTVLDTNVLVMH